MRARGAANGYTDPPARQVYRTHAQALGMTPSPTQMHFIVRMSVDNRHSDNQQHTGRNHWAKYASPASICSNPGQVRSHHSPLLLLLPTDMRPTFQYHHTNTNTNSKLQTGSLHFNTHNFQTPQQPHTTIEKQPGSAATPPTDASFI